MIPIRKFNEFLEDLVAQIEGLEAFHLVVEDSHAVHRLRDKIGIHLVAVTPNASRSGDVGRAEDYNATYFFVLEKLGSDADPSMELNQYERTQNIMLAVREYIEESAEDGCLPFYRLQVPSINIDPEYNIFGGWNGYSMLFTF